MKKHNCLYMDSPYGDMFSPYCVYCGKMEIPVFDQLIVWIISLFATAFIVFVWCVIMYFITGFNILSS